MRKPRVAAAKDASVALVERLDLPRHGWTVVDHWDADLAAIGIASSAEPRRLVYVSTYRKAPGRFDYECESPPSAPEETYAEGPRGRGATFDELLAAVTRHLGVRHSDRRDD